MKKEKYMSWDCYFMAVAILSSFRSKDKKTQNGACIVNAHKRIVGVGYNGLPRGLSDELPHVWEDEDDKNIYCSKHTYVIHAEQNAIHNRISQNLEDATLYVTQFPCKECTKSIVQVGIKKVVYLRKKLNHEEENKAAELMFRSAEIEYISFNDLDIEDKEFVALLTQTNEFYEN